MVFSAQELVRTKASLIILCQREEDPVKKQAMYAAAGFLEEVIYQGSLVKGDQRPTLVSMVSCWNKAELPELVKTFLEWVKEEVSEEDVKIIREMAWV